MAESGGMVQWLRNPAILLREDEQEGALLFHPGTNQIRAVNATGLFIWKLCDGSHDMEGMIAALKKEYDGVSESEARIQVQAFIDDMKASGFIDG